MNGNTNLTNKNKCMNNMKITKNPRDFWSKIGRLGLANDRRTAIPWEVRDSNGILRTEVLHMWKSDYEHLFNGGLICLKRQDLEYFINVLIVYVLIVYI